jgi:hypothetical protein
MAHIKKYSLRCRGFGRLTKTKSMEIALHLNKTLRDR